MRTASITIGLALVGMCPGLRAQDAPAPARAGAAAKTSADEQAIAGLVAAFTKAFNAGDAAAAAATYTEDALVVDEEGDRTEGREAIRTSSPGRSPITPAPPSPSRPTPSASSAPRRRSRRAGRSSRRPAPARPPR